MMLSQSIAATLLGLWAGVMAWSGWAVYHDGVRPLVGEWAEGNLDRSELTAVAAESSRPFALGSLGLSLVFGVPLAHWLWLPAEGLAFRSRRLWQAALVGALWGLAAWLVIWGGRSLAAGLPVSLLPAWERSLSLILGGMLFAPALAAGHRWGTRTGAVALALSAVGAVIGLWAAPGLRLAAAVALGSLMGTFTFAVLVYREVRTQAPVDSVLPVRPRRAPLWALVIQGVLLAFAVRSGAFGWGMADGIAAGHGWWLMGAAVVLPRVFAFAPQWASSQAGTGVGQLAGTGLAVLAGFLSPSPWLAPLLGGVVVLLEPAVSGYALRHSALSEAGESMRWATGKCGQAAVLAAMVWAAADLLPTGLGAAVVIAVIVVNDYVPNGIWKMAVPAWGLLLAGLLANLWHMLGGV